MLNSRKVDDEIKPEEAFRSSSTVSSESIEETRSPEVDASLEMILAHENDKVRKQYERMEGNLEIFRSIAKAAW